MEGDADTAHTRPHDPVTDPVTLVLADPETLSCESLGRLLKADGLSVLGQAADGRSALELAKRLGPDVILFKLDSSGRPSIGAIGRIRQDAPGARVLVLAGDPDPDLFREAIAGGAHGYLLSDTSIEEIAAAVRAVARGESPLSPIVATTLVEQLQADQPHEMAVEDRPELTARELDVLRLIVEGRENREIAESLGLSVSTVKSHVSNVVIKLQAKNRTEAAVNAIRERLV